MRQLHATTQSRGRVLDEIGLDVGTLPPLFLTARSTFEGIQLQCSREDTRSLCFTR